MKKETPSQTEERIEKALNDSAEVLKPIVIKIEASPLTSKNHYQDYLKLLSAVTNPMTRRLTALALIRAGANKEGVNSALNLL